MIDQIANDVLIVIDGRNGRQVTPDENRIGRVEHVPDKGLRVIPKILLIKLIVHQEIPMIRGERTLVGITRSSVRRARDLDGRGLIADIHDGHGVLVGRKAEFFPAKSLIGSCIGHAFDIVRVPICAEATHPSR